MARLFRLLYRRREEWPMLCKDCGLDMPVDRAEEDKLIFICRNKRCRSSGKEVTVYCGGRQNQPEAEA